MQRRSVNLAISSRGLTALEFVDSQLAARFLENAIPMRGRIIHDTEGSHLQLYDPVGGVSYFHIFSFYKFVTQPMILTSFI